MESRSESNIKGIDISSYQSSINFDTVKNDGYSAVIIKATEGVNYVDPELENHYINASNSGLSIGFYHFMSEKTSPSRQALDFWNAISDKSYNIFPVLDIESNNLGRSKGEVTNRCLEFLNEFKSISGIDCIIYTYTSFAREYIDDRLSSYKLWIAHYGVNTPGNNPVWDSWQGFQYTDTGKINGLYGYYDLNEFTEGMFLGSRNEDTGSTTENWVARLQQEINRQGFGNLIVDGIAGPKTLAAAPMVKYGAIGGITKLIQERVNVTTDGIFGINTKTAVIEYQVANYLDGDGIVGKYTWSKLLGLS